MSDLQNLAPVGASRRIAISGRSGNWLEHDQTGTGFLSHNYLSRNIKLPRPNLDESEDCFWGQDLGNG